AQDEQQAPILGKFKSTDELARAYQELERKLGQPPQEQQQPPPEPPPAVEPDESDADEGQTLPTFGSPEEEAQFTQSVISAVGGQEVFESLAAWAPEYGDPVTVNAFNLAVSKGDAPAALMAVKALRYEMTQRQGYTPTLVGGLALGSQSGPQPFTSNAELRAAMRDPRYLPGPNQDGAYVEEVQRRLSASLR
ncbi:MAG: capsid assembly protein, partial [Steroidobacteraceae bacterium]